MRLRIRHNMEMAHRLSLAPESSKCYKIHGHGMQVELTFMVNIGADGMAINSANQPMEFGAMKKMFRDYIDSTYDHHIVLNEEDPWSRPLVITEPENGGEIRTDSKVGMLPGLVTVPGDPTTENLSMWIAEWACNTYRVDVICKIDETKTNGAEAAYHWNSFGARMIEGAL